MNVSLDRSEGSLLSEDGLDTEDEALDTGDDLDVNIDELDTPDEADLPEFNEHGQTHTRTYNTNGSFRPTHTHSHCIFSKKVDSTNVNVLLCCLYSNRGVRQV